MENLNQQFALLEARFDALSGREKFYVLVVVCVVVYGGWDYLIHARYDKERAVLMKSLSESETRFKTASQRLQIIAEQQAIDPNVPVRQRLDRLDRELEVLEARKQDMAASFITPRAMANLLQNLLASQTGLKLVGMETIPERPLVKSSDDGKQQRPKDAPPAPMIYRHDIVIEFDGSYFDMVRYLKVLEDQPVFWDAAEFVVKNHPTARVRLQVYTLSFEREWLGV